MVLTKEQILAMRLPVEEVDVPWEPGAKIRVRALPPHALEAYAKIQGEGGNPNVHAFVWAVVDENRRPMWSEADQQMLAETLDPGLVALVAAAAIRLSTLSPEKLAAIKKNSPIRDDSSSGESPSPSGDSTPTT